MEPLIKLINTDKYICIYALIFIFFIGFLTDLLIKSLNLHSSPPLINNNYLFKFNNKSFNLNIVNYNEKNIKIYEESLNKILNNIINLKSKKICVICLNDINECVKLNCNHYFHKKCFIDFINYEIDKKNILNTKCPYCRQKLIII